MKDKIRFRDLSVPLKIGVVAAWLVGILYLITFLIYFVIGVLYG